MALRIITPTKRADTSLDPITSAAAKLHLKVDDTADDSLIAAIITAVRLQCEDHVQRALIRQVWDLTLDDWPEGEDIQIPLGDLLSVAWVKYYGTENTEYTMDAADYIIDADSSPGRVHLAYSKTWPSTTLRPANGVRVRFSAGCYRLAGFTADAATETLTSAAHGLSNGDLVEVKSSGTLPGGLVAATGYYVINQAANTLQLSTAAGGAAIDITTAGTGTHSLVISRAAEVPENVKQAMLLGIGHYYEHREEVVLGHTAIQSLPLAKGTEWLLAGAQVFVKGGA